MNHRPLQEHDQLAVSYLQQLQDLAFEISIAMDAIAANALSRFQESVAKQEMLCFNLMLLADAIREGFPALKDPLNSYEPPYQRVLAASEAIRKLNLRYAALLKHSGRSIALLSSLCRNHLGESKEVRGLTLKRQTWSCEM